MVEIHITIDGISKWKVILEIIRIDVTKIFLINK